MKINVRVHPKSSSDKIEQRDGIWHIYTSEIPENGKANSAVQSILAEYFDKSAYQIRLVSGFKSKDKIFSIDD